MENPAEKSCWKAMFSVRLHPPIQAGQGIFQSLRWTQTLLLLLAPKPLLAPGVESKPAGKTREFGLIPFSLTQNIPH